MTTQQIRGEVDGKALADLLTERTGVRPVPATLAATAGAEAVRRLGLILVADSDDRWALLVERIVTELLGDRPGAPSRFHRSQSTDGDEYPMGSHPTLGAGNPVAPPITLSLDPDQRALVGRVTFGPPFEGLPGSVFGGHVAAGFDSVLGVAAALTGSAVVVRRMTVEYHTPTPLNIPVEFVVPVPATGAAAEDAVVQVCGQLEIENGEVTATASADCVARNRSQFCAPVRDDQSVLNTIGGVS